MRPGSAAVWAMLAGLLLAGAAEAEEFSWENPSNTGKISGVDNRPAEPRAQASPAPSSPAKKPAAARKNWWDPPPAEEPAEPAAETVTEPAEGSTGSAEEAGGGSIDVPVTYSEASDDAPAEPATQTRSSGTGKLSLFINDAKDQEMLRGWPMIVKVTVEPTGEQGFVLDGDGKPWTDAVEIETRDERSRIYALPYKLAPIVQPSSRLEVGPNQAATAIYLLSPQDTQVLKTGTYRLSAVAGGVTSPAVTINLEDHPEELSDEQETRRDRLMAVYHALRGETEKARRFAQAPAPVYVMAAPPSYPQNGGGDAGAGELLALLGQFGVQNAFNGGGYDDYSSDDSSDYSSDYTSDYTDDGGYDAEDE